MLCEKLEYVLIWDALKWGYQPSGWLDHAVGCVSGAGDELQIMATLKVFLFACVIQFDSSLSVDVGGSGWTQRRMRRLKTACLGLNWSFWNTVYSSMCLLISCQMEICEEMCDMSWGCVCCVFIPQCNIYNKNNW